MTTTRRKIETFIDLIQREAGRQPVDLTNAIRNLPSMELLPWPDEAWALVCVNRYSERQVGLRQAVMNLSAEQNLELERFGRTFGLNTEVGRDWIAHKPGDSKLIELHHPERQERITVEVVRTCALPPFSVRMLRNQFDDGNNDACHCRLRQLHTVCEGADTLDDSFITLERAGLVARTSDGHTYELSDISNEHRQALSDFAEGFNDPRNQLWLGAIAGDWQLVLQLARSTPKIAQLAQRRLYKYRRLRLAAIEAEAGDGVLPQRFALQIHAIGGDGLWKWAVQHPDRIDVSRWRGIMPGRTLLDRRWREHLHSALRRCIDNGDRDGILVMAWAMINAECLPDGAEDLLADLGASDPCFSQSCAALLLGNAPAKSLPAMRLALRSGSKLIAHALGVADLSWSREELWRAIDDLLATRVGDLRVMSKIYTCLCALGMSRDADIRARAVEQWQSLLNNEEIELPGCEGTSAFDLGLAIRATLPDYASVGGP